MMGEDFSTYDGNWYSDQAKPEHLRQTEIVAESIYEVLRPKSVIDVGCGIGTMLNAMSKHGVGIVGTEAPHAFNISEWRKVLQIPIELVFPVDLREPLMNIVGVSEVCICSEVGEHLPKASADKLVQFVTSLAVSCVVWTAAIPGQGGNGHINEQSPEYWAEKFKICGFAEDKETAAKIITKFSGKIPMVNWYANLHVYRRAT